MKKWKRVLAFALAMGFAVNAFAFWSLLAPVGSAIMWLGRAASANVTMARAVEWSIYAHGAVLGFLTWKNNSDTSTQATTPINARLVVQPSSSAQRDNPDPKRYNDAAAGQRDPAPKSTYSDGSAAPGNGSNAAMASAGIGSFTYSAGTTSSGAPQVMDVDVLQSYQVGLTQAQASDAVKSATSAAHSGWNYSWGYTISTTDWRVIWSRTRPAACANGYTLSSSGVCNLVDSTQVQKPAGKVPCEVVKNSDGTWDVDSKNPECTGLAAALTANKNTLTYNKGDGTYDTITNNADGTSTIQTGNRTIALGAQNTDGTFPITGITDSSQAPSPNTGTGSTGAGSSGAGGAVCGGPGLPACSVSVDDSGFNGKDTAINSLADTAKGALDDRLSLINSKATDTSNFGLDLAWIPSLLPGAAVSCQELKWEPGITHGPLTGVAGTQSVDWCSRLDVIRDYLAWLFGVITIIAIAMLFFSSNGNTGKGK
jgi:hypothetical protein